MNPQVGSFVFANNGIVIKPTDILKKLMFIPSEERIREIIREEIAKALEAK